MTDTHTPRQLSGDDADGTFRNAKTLFRIRGVPIRVDVSWLLIAGLVIYVFATQFSVLLGDRGTATVVLSATVAAVLFFSCLLAHELGHALTSLDRGIPVLGVTLFLMGGVTESTAEAKTAKDEFVIVGIGPYISLVLAALFGLLFVLVQRFAVPAAISGYLAWTNLALAVFNVLPGYPLDGGRLLRSLLWMATGSPHRATRWAARVGQLFAFALIALGLLGFVRGGGFSGIWEVLIGGFLLRGATDAHRRARLRERLSGRKLREVMTALPQPLAAEQALSDAVVVLQARPSVLFPVVDAVPAGGSGLLGVVQLADLDQVPRQDWWARTVGDVMTPADGTAGAVALDADEDLDAALDALASAPRQQLVITEGNRPVGLLSSASVTDAVGS